MHRRGEGRGDKAGPSHHLISLEDASQVAVAGHLPPGPAASLQGESLWSPGSDCCLHTPTRVLLHP